MKKSIICWVALGIATVYTIGLLVFAQTTNQPSVPEQPIQSMEYAGKLFDTSKVHRVEIEIPEERWEDLKFNALKKNYYECTVTIDGDIYYHTGVRTKGNMSLMQTMMHEEERYSIVLDFGVFNESQRYYGLDKLVLNNNISDSSFLRDYLCYSIMREQGVPSPLCSFTEVYLNGELIGLYTAIEGIDEAFAIRNFGHEYGCMYKPENMNIGNMLTGAEKDFMFSLEALSDHSEGVNSLDFLGVTDTVVGLNYLGEDLSEYNQIWNNAVFPIDNEDKRRLINSIRSVNERQDLSEVLDIPSLVQYFAINTFVVNDDNYNSYQGHNYVLYEKEGRLMMLPWDYDHSLGCVGPADGMLSMTEITNLPIDEPLIGTTLAERPMLNALLGNDEYKLQYEAALDELVSKYVESGYLESKINDLSTLLRPYIQNAPEEFVSEERFCSSVGSVRDFINLRGASIRGQLSGEIPRTFEGQRLNHESLVDGSVINCPDSGGMMDLLFPDNSGVYVEDFLIEFKGKINPFALLGAIPWAEVLKDISDGSEESDTSSLQKLINSGKINDEKVFKCQIKLIAQDLIGYCILIISIPIVLVAMLIYVITFNRRRRPIPIKDWRKKNAV